MRTFERLREQRAKALDERKWKRAESIFVQMQAEMMARLRTGIEVERQMIDDDIFAMSPYREKVQ